MEKRLEKSNSGGESDQLADGLANTNEMEQQNKDSKNNNNSPKSPVRSDSEYYLPASSVRSLSPPAKHTESNEEAEIDQQSKQSSVEVPKSSKLSRFETCTPLRKSCLAVVLAKSRKDIIGKLRMKSKKKSFLDSLSLSIKSMALSVNSQQQPAILYDRTAASFQKGRLFFARTTMHSSSLDTHRDISYNSYRLNIYLQVRQLISSKLNELQLKKSKTVTRVKEEEKRPCKVPSVKAKQSSQRSRRRKVKSRFSIDSEKTCYLPRLIKSHEAQDFKRLALRKSFDLRSSLSSTSSLCVKNVPEVPTPAVVSAEGYYFLRKVGEGAFSTIYEAYSPNNPGLRYACKLINITTFTGENSFMMNFLKQEIHILSTVTHPYIVALFDVIHTPNEVFILMKFAQHGTICDYLYKFWMKPLPEPYAKKWMVHIMMALYFAHGKQIAHRDLKLENFLLDEKYTALLSDFGMAVCMDSSYAGEMLSVQCGTTDYMAPELHIASNSNSTYDPFPADIYSMGICLFEMVNYFRPFNISVSDSDLSILYRQRRRKYVFNKKIYLTKECHDLLHQMLDPTPESRPTAISVLEDVWLQNSIRRPLP